MKKVLLPLFLLMILSACSKDEEPDTDQVDFSKVEVEDFIFRAMNEWYLYESDVPELADGHFSSDTERYDYLSGFDSPEALFEDLQASHDRFSFMTSDYHELENMLYNGVEKTTGMIYGLGTFSDDPNKVFGIVYYVLPNSSAQEQGVVRGDAFREINGQQLTLDNYRSLLGLDSFTLTIADIDGQSVINTDRTASLVNEVMSENPVFLTKILEQEGQKIGYLVYNGFTMDFDSELNQAFAEFKTAGIQHLILDLRYNGGGSVNTAIDLASMITGQFEGELFAQTMLNDKWQEIYQSQGPEYLQFQFDSELGAVGSGGEAINSLNLDQVYVIATKRSASASELLINGLSPYIDVVHVGESTAGKFQASWTLYDSDNIFFDDSNPNPNHTYAIQPLIMKLANANGVTDFHEGLSPDIEVSEDLANYQPFGDPSEVLLEAAINDILGLPQEEPSAVAKQAESNFSIFGNSQMFQPIYQRMYLNNPSPLNESKK